MSQCTAKSKRTGERCRAQAITGRDKCRNHGGISLRGVDHPSTIHGRRSKYMPRGLARHYDEDEADPRVHQLDDEIRLVDARITELLGQLTGGTGGSLWANLTDAWAAFEAARRLPEAERGQAMADRLAEVGELVRAGRSEHITWTELGKQIDRKAALLERRSRMTGMYTAEQMLLLLQAVASIVTANVEDRSVRAKIGREVEAVLDGNTWRALPQPARPA